MKKLITALLIPLSAMADPLPGNAGEYIRAVQSLVKTERVVVEGEGVGLLIPAIEMFSGSGELMEGGRQVLEKAGRFATQAKGKLTILMPDEREHEDFRPVTGSLHGGQVKRNVFVGPFVYIVVAKC